MKRMTIHPIAAAALALALAACNQGTPPAPPAAPSAPAAPGAPETALGRAAERAINQARSELATQNISLNGEFNFNGKNHRNVMARVGKKDASDPRPDAELTPDGDMLIDGRKVEVTPEQHAMLVQYRKEIMTVAETGMALGIAGADMGGKALGEVARGIFSGNPDQIDKNIKQQAGALEAQAKLLCTQLQPILDSQQKLAASLPAFKPYATMTQADVGDCHSGSESDSRNDATRAEVRDEIRANIREAVRGTAQASVAAAAAGATASASAAANAANAGPDATGNATRDVESAVRATEGQVRAVEAHARAVEAQAREVEAQARTAGKAGRRNPPCGFKRPIDAKLDLAGIKTVQFRVGSDDLLVDAAKGGGSVTGNACASSKEGLDAMHFEQKREGDRLVVSAWHTGNFSGVSNMNFGPLRIQRYSYMQLKAAVPDDVTVQVVARSGNVTVNNAHRSSVDLGSGDVVLNNVREGAWVDLRSGNVEVNGAGSAQLLSLGSGDATLRDVRGPVRIGDVGSGNVKLLRAGSSVDVGELGSGDIDMEDVAGNVVVGSVGSGDVSVRNVRGGLTVKSLGSGDVNHEGVTGPVSVPAKR